MSIHPPTIDNYKYRAKSFQNWASDQTPHVEDARRNFIAAVKKSNKDLSFQTYRILDIGCGSGRDAQYFQSLEAVNEVIAIDPVEEFCTQTKTLIGESRVFCTDVLGYEGPKQFDGIYTMASLFHINRNQLNATLKKIHSLLCENGVFLSTFPSGVRNINEQGVDGRWKNAMPLEIHEYYLRMAGFVIEKRFRVEIYNGVWDALLVRKQQLGMERDIDEFLRPPKIRKVAKENMVKLFEQWS